MAHIRLGLGVLVVEFSRSKCLGIESRALCIVHRRVMNRAFAEVWLRNAAACDDSSSAY